MSRAVSDLFRSEEKEMLWQPRKKKNHCVALICDMRIYAIAEKCLNVHEHTHICLHDVALAPVSMKPMPFAPVLERLSLTDMKIGLRPKFTLPLVVDLLWGTSSVVVVETDIFNPQECRDCIHTSW